MRGGVLSAMVPLRPPPVDSLGGREGGLSTFFTSTHATLDEISLSYRTSTSWPAHARHGAGAPTTPELVAPAGPRKTGKHGLGEEGSGR